jgi:hypothetical protein
MRLVDRLSKNSGTAPTPDAPASLIGGTPVRKRDDIAEGSRRLKIRVHNRLLETLDVSKLDALEPAMVSGKVTSAINETLNDEGRLLTEVDRARLISEIKMSCSDSDLWNHCSMTTTSRTSWSMAIRRSTSKNSASSIARM